MIIHCHSLKTSSMIINLRRCWLFVRDMQIYIHTAPVFEQSFMSSSCWMHTGSGIEKVQVGTFKSQPETFLKKTYGANVSLISQPAKSDTVGEHSCHSEIDLPARNGKPAFICLKTRAHCFKNRISSRKSATVIIVNCMCAMSGWKTWQALKQ